MGFAERWMGVPAGTELALGLRGLLILPSRFGWLWLLTCLVLHLLGVNGGSGGPVLLASLGLGLFLLALPLTPFTLQGLRLSCGRPQPGFADQTLHYPVVIHSPARRGPVRLRLAGREVRELTLPAGRVVVSLAWRPRRRGRLRPGRLRISATAPLGLFRCWAVWEPAAAQLVYPARQAGPLAEWGPPGGSAAAAAARRSDDGCEELNDLVPHRREEGPARLAWKQLARTGERLSKRFDDPRPGARLLAPAEGIPLERALQALSHRIWELSHQGLAYGLQLGGQRLGPGQGRRHRDRCLQALALWRGDG